MPQTQTWHGFPSHFACALKCKSSVCDLVRVSSLILVLTGIDKKDETDSNKQSDLHFVFNDFYQKKMVYMLRLIIKKGMAGSNGKSRLHIPCKYKRNIYNWGGTVNDFSDVNVNGNFCPEFLTRVLSAARTLTNVYWWIFCLSDVTHNWSGVSCRCFLPTWNGGKQKLFMCTVRFDNC